MAELDKINVNGELYDMSDSKARSDIASEITNRTNADATLQTNIDNEANARTSADNELNQKIVQETTNRTNADNALQEKINTNKTGIDNLVNDVAARNVKAEEVTNVPEVKLPLDEVKEEIEAAGNRVLNSIPDDYTQINNKVSELKSDLDDLIIKAGNVLKSLTSEQKVISTHKNDVVFYDNDLYSTFFVPIKNGNKIYVASLLTSGYTPIRYAFVDFNRTGLASTYVSTDVYPSTPIEIASPIDGYFAVCGLNENVSYLSVSIGKLDTSDKNRLSNDVILQNGHLEQAKIYVNDNIFINKLNGKVLYPIGDSITYGSGLLQADKKWWNYVSERYGMTVKYAENSSLTPSINGKIDAQVGRAFTKDGSASTRFTQRIKEIPSDADVVIIFGGTNDFGLKNVEIGSMDDISSDANGGISLYSALKYCGEYLSQNHNDKTIIFMTPLPRNSKDEEFNAKDSHGKRLIDYAEAIKTMCRCFGFYCVDLNNIGEFYVGSQTWIDENTFISDTGDGHGDGLHPNATCTEKFTKNGIFPALDSFFVSVQ